MYSKEIHGGHQMRVLLTIPQRLTNNYSPSVMPFPLCRATSYIRIHPKLGRHPTIGIYFLESWHLFVEE